MSNYSIVSTMELSVIPDYWSSIIVFPATANLKVLSVWFLRALVHHCGSHSQVLHGVSACFLGAGACFSVYDTCMVASDS